MESCVCCLAFSAFFHSERCGEGNVAKNNREVTIAVTSFFMAKFEVALR